MGEVSITIDTGILSLGIGGSGGAEEKAGVTSAIAKKEDVSTTNMNAIVASFPCNTTNLIHDGTI